MRPRHLARLQWRTIQADVKKLFDALARGDRDLQSKLGWSADLELEPGGDCATHGR